MEHTTHLEQPLVSILMTAYNREKYIEEAIQSVLNSSYQNFELIIVDDCSKDRTVEIARRFEKKDLRVKVYVNPQNLGDYPNRNKAASYAKGKYLKYVDADDLIYAFGLSVMVEEMEKNPSAAYGLNGISQDDNGIYPRLVDPVAAYEMEYEEQLGVFGLPPTNSIIRKDVFERELGFKTAKMVSDMEMWHRLSLRYPMMVFPYGLTWCRSSHTDSESGKWMNDPAVKYEYLRVRRHFLCLEECPLIENKKNNIRKKIARSQAKLIVNLMLKFKRKIVNDILVQDSISIVELCRMSF